ncbi:MAG TPA: apolipoprotein N-acyltransferase [Sphingobacteriaceae bacterium]
MQKTYLLAILTAFLLWLGWPPIPYTAPLLLIAFVPLFLAADRIIGSDLRKKGRKIFLVSGTAFLLWNTASIYWVFNSMNAVMPSWIALLISLIPFGLAALLMTLAFRLYYTLRGITGRAWSYAGLVCFWIGYEYLHQSWDLAFPWMTLGNGFAGTHQLVQWYEYTGVYGGTYWILVSNILVYETWRAFRTADKPRVRWIWAIRSAAHILIPAVISLVMYSRYEEQVNPSNVVVVQPNIDPYGKWNTIPSSAQVRQLIRLSDSVGQANTEYFIWPETAIPDYTDEERIRENANFRAVQQFLGKYPNGNVISGIESYLLYDDARTPTARLAERFGKYSDYFNTAVQIENSPRVQFYHKSRLVPGVEQLPFASALSFMKPVFAAFGGSTGGFGSQEKPSVFYSRSGIGAAPVICYESIWGDYIAEYVSQGAQFIAIITNDGWWGNTSGKDQHFLYAKLRAIETRRWVVRSANTGISGFIDQRGDVIRRSEWWVPTALKQDINLNDEQTFYVRTGDYFATAGCLGSGAFAVLIAVSVFRRRKS